MKRILLFIIALTFYYLGAAQNKSVEGFIFDEKNKPVPYATVMLKSSSDSLLHKGEITDETGKYILSNVKGGNYFLQVQFLGYASITIQGINIDETPGVYEMEKIILQTGSEQLAPVTISAEKPFIERMADRTVVNIENSIIQTGSSIMEVMEKLPGVMVDQDGNLRLRGKQGVIIMIDGKRTSLSGQDLVNMMRGMSSGNIQKIELITNPSAKYEADGNAGIINIIMKKNQMQGYNGNISLGYGQGRFPKYNTSLNFNYKKNWFNLFFNYSYSKRKGFNHLVINRKFYEQGEIITVFDNNNYIIFPFSTHTPRLGMDFRLSDKTSVSLLGSNVINHFEPGADNSSVVSGPHNEILGKYNFTNRSMEKFYNMELNSQINHKFDTLGQELIVNLDYGTYQSNSDQVFTTVFTNYDGSIVPTVLLNYQKGDLDLYSIKADYSKPFKGNLTFEAGFKSSLVESDKNMRFYDKIEHTEFYNYDRSSHFIYKENINAAYINFNKKFEKLTLQAGLRAEQTIADGEQLLSSQDFKRDYIQLFPTAYFDYKFNEIHSINLNIGRRIDRPQYGQLDPFRRLIDANTYSEGNPYLQPQINYISELNYSYKNALNLAFNYNYSVDNIMQILIQDAVTKTTIQTAVNIEEYQYYSFNISYSNRLTKWWRINTSFLTYYGKYSGIIRDYLINRSDPSFYISSNHSFSVADGLSVEAGLNYNHKNLYGVTLMKSTTNFSLGVQKSVFKKKGTITANVSDIFWTAWPSGVTEFGSVVEHWSSQRETRIFNINFSYKFGSGQTGRMRRDTGADEEKRRIN